MKWILKVDCELEKEEKTSGKKLQKKFGRQEEFIYFFVNFVTNIKNYLVELTEVGCKTFFFCNLSLSRVHRLKWKTFDNINLNQTC